MNLIHGSPIEKLGDLAWVLADPSSRFICVDYNPETTRQFSRRTIGDVITLLNEGRLNYAVEILEIPPMTKPKRKKRK